MFYLDLKSKALQMTYFLQPRKHWFYYCVTFFRLWTTCVPDIPTPYSNVAHFFTVSIVIGISGKKGRKNGKMYGSYGFVISDFLFNPVKVILFFVKRIFTIYDMHSKQNLKNIRTKSQHDTCERIRPAIEPDRNRPRHPKCSRNIYFNFWLDDFFHGFM